MTPLSASKAAHVLLHALLISLKISGSARMCGAQTNETATKWARSTKATLSAVEAEGYALLHVVLVSLAGDVCLIQDRREARSQDVCGVLWGMALR